MLYDIKLKYLFSIQDILTHLKSFLVIFFEKFLGISVKRFLKYTAILTLLILISSPILSAQPETVLNSARIKLALEKLNVVGSVLYIAAHPDDENTAVLSYYSSGKHYRTGYLSMTSGDGGQNLIGTEQGDMLSVVRTQELLAARKIDGAEQFFTRAIDFGFSKSADETLQIWNHEKILSDVVWVIRKFRPDVIITRFPGTGEGGHGNHTASEMLAEEAFKAANDSTKFSVQLKYVKPWQPKRIYWNAWLPIIEKRKEDKSKLISLDVGGYNPLLGKSYTEVASQSRSMHKSQGFGTSSSYGKDINYFEYIDGDTANNNLFEDVNTSWSRIEGGEKVGKILKEANEKFDPVNPEKIIPVLLKAYKEMNKLDDTNWVPIKRKELLNVIRSCSGIWMEATADNYSSYPGGKVSITTGIENRSDFPFILNKIVLKYGISTELNVKLDKEEFIKNSFQLSLPDTLEYSQPYWLKNPHSKGFYKVEDQRLIGLPENSPPLFAQFYLSAEDQTISYKVPILYRWTDPVKGEKYRPFEVAPEVAVNIEEGVHLFPDDSTKKIKIKLISNSANAEGKLKLSLPSNWKVSPAEIKFSFSKKYDEKIFLFKITPPNDTAEAVLKATAEINGRKISNGILEINYSHIPIQIVFPPSTAKTIKLDTKKVVTNIGYIIGPGDEIPPYLKQLGYNVTLLSDEFLDNGDYSKFETIITGIRAYNTRERLVINNNKLLNYVKNGGTLVVQYNVNNGLLTQNIGPFPFEISRDRVTLEDAPVAFISPQNSLLNFPNKITHHDFDGWIQERGLYFADKWDTNYQTVIECNDPHENPKPGGMLYTKYGKGAFIYTAYSWFRQIPAGVPGAFRIFIKSYFCESSEYCKKLN